MMATCVPNPASGGKIKSIAAVPADVKMTMPQNIHLLRIILCVLFEWAKPRDFFQIKGG